MTDVDMRARAVALLDVVRLHPPLAEKLEGRDDLGLEPSHENTLKDFLAEMATPEIFEPITPEVATKWLRRL